jgi:hypothetical protein
MGILHSQDFDGGHPGPIQPAILSCEDRIMSGSENQAIRVIQVHRKLAFPLALRQLVASTGPAFGRPKIHEGRCCPMLRHSQTNFPGSLGSMNPIELRPLAELFLYLSGPKGYIQNLFLSNNY